MGLRPEKMGRIRIISLTKYRQGIVSILHNMRVIQLESVSKDFSSLLGSSNLDEQVDSVNDELQRIKGYESSLPPLGVDRRKIGGLEEALSEAKKIDLGDEIKVLKSRQEDILTDIKDIKNRMEAVQPLIGLDADLSVFNTSMTKSYIVSSNLDVDIEAILRSEVRDCLIIQAPSGKVIATIRSDSERGLATVCNSNGFQMMHIPEMHGKPADYYENLVGMLNEKSKHLEEIGNELLEISKAHYSSIVQVREQLEIELQKLEAAQRSLSSGEIFAIEGWVKMRDYENISSRINRFTNGACLVNTIHTDEMPPTAMRNPKGFNVFEFFIRFYSLPVENEFDPTLIFAIIFPFFFGLMVGDWGYGLIILLVSLWMVRKIRHPETFSIFPKRISSFAVQILGKGPLLVLAKVLIPSSIIAIITGVVFNQFFGFHILPFTIVNVDSNYGITKLLLLSGYIGLAMVSFGFVLGILNDVFTGEKKKAIGAGGWLMLAWGVAITGLNFIHKSPISLDPVTGPATALPIYIAILGIILVAIMEKSRGMIEVPSLISHILSYTRIVGILLASVILALVVNDVFMSDIHKGIAFILLGGIILVLGQIFNLAIAIFEPGIQGARLLYVEFFSKFYRGNGRQFRPFGSRRKYTLPDEPED